MRPPYQISLSKLHLPVQGWRVIDADTIVVRCLTPVWYTIRLSDWAPEYYDAPEKRTAEGIVASHYVEQTLEEQAGHLSVEVRIPERIRKRLLEGLEADILGELAIGGRVPGNIWVSDEDTLVALLKRKGHVKK